MAARTRSAVFLLVAIVLVVPPLVRAASTAPGGQPIRLNRGFNFPPAKCHIAPPPEATAAVAPTVEPTAPRAVWIAVSVAAPLPALPAAAPPDALRGPPPLLA